MAHRVGTRDVSKPIEDGEHTIMANEPVIAQKGPYQVELEAGKAYFWCTCGRSGKQPFCDGSHKDTGHQPMRFVPEASGVANLCGCKQSDDMPFCDGSHNIL